MSMNNERPEEAFEESTSSKSTETETTSAVSYTHLTLPTMRTV